MKKMMLVIEREDGKKITRQITEKQASALFDLQFMLNDIWETIKINKIEKDIGDFFRSINYIYHDAFHEGKVYKYEDGKFKEERKRWYMITRPKWK